MQDPEIKQITAKILFGNSIQKESVHLNLMYFNSDRCSSYYFQKAIWGGVGGGGVRFFFLIAS